MLRHDPIVQRHPELLPSEYEVRLTRELLELPEHRALWEALCRDVQIGGSPEAVLWRLCWQAREEHKRGQECAEGAVEWLKQCLAARRRLAMDTLLQQPPFDARLREVFLAAMPFSFHRTDRGGHPMFIVRFGKADVSLFEQLWQEGQRISEAKGLAVNAAVLFHLRAVEYATKVVMAEETERQGQVVDRMLLILDVQGLRLQHWSSVVRAYLGAVSKESVPLFPETMHATVLANVPRIVARAIWPVASKLLHPVTQGKFIFVTQQELPDRIAELVEPGNLPPYLGGCCSCKECASGQLQGGSMWSWEWQEGLLQPATQSPTSGGVAGAMSVRSFTSTRSSRWLNEGVSCVASLCCSTRTKEKEERFVEADEDLQALPGRADADEECEGRGVKPHPPSPELKKLDEGWCCWPSPGRCSLYVVGALVVLIALAMKRAASA